MQKKIYTLLFLASALIIQAQSLRDLNYNYLYNPSEKFILKWKITNLDKQLELHYSIEASSETGTLNGFSLQVEIRNSLAEKEGSNIGEEIPIDPVNKKTGKINLDSSTVGKFAVLKVIRTGATAKTATLFYKPIPASSTPTLFKEVSPVLQTYSRINDRVHVKGLKQDQPHLVSYYDNEFPAAGPPFSTAQAGVSVTIKPDSTFTVLHDALFSLNEKGLYLVQDDTTSSIGLAFRIEDDYPKVGKLESLHGPMIYICTKLEYDKVKAAGSDKAKFDKVILNITGNSDRAKIFMRSYFKRVEQANAYFSSYKEGWKTDRGMIYIIYGLPEAVYLSEDREVWEYKNTNFKGRLTFVRSSTLFDPENYVLIREKKLSDTWYLMIDLWRKARF
ncbi:MAG: GWxTD domain-containing protein [Cyclobacteriaceae bacterium]|nr:GWxTD domain-containing protein [Cyclobacteriaceae bacterium]